MGSYLIVRARTRACALPTEHIVETFRPLPCHPMPSAPDYVCGVARVRGELAPVLDLGRLLHEDDAPNASRYVSIRVGDRRACLAVEEVLGVRTLTSSDVLAVPPLLQSTDTDIVSEIGRLDRDLLFVLGSFRGIPESVWQTLHHEQPS